MNDDFDGDICTGSASGTMAATLVALALTVAALIAIHAIWVAP